MRKRIFEIIQIGNRTDFPSTFFDIFISVVIISNIMVTFLQTFDKVVTKFGGAFYWIELITIVIFLVEYILRVWTGDLLYPQVSKTKGKLKFIVSFYGIVDLLTILPYFLPLIFPGGIVAFRMLRVVRIFHLFRVNSTYDAFNVITEVLKEKRNQLVSSIFLILIMMLGSSLCIYGLEHEAQPEIFANAFSGIWWSVSTLLTVGYGDIYPITVAGKCMAIVIAFLGVGMVAIPTGIISAGFVEYYTRIKAGINATAESRNATGKPLEGERVILSKEHPWRGCKISDLNPEIHIVSIINAGRRIAFENDTILEENDEIVFLTVK